MTSPDRLISHEDQSDRSYEQAAEAAKARLRAGGDLPGATVEQQLAVVDQLASFELGRFLLVNRGLDAYWTHRLVTYVPGTLKRGEVSDLEYQVFEQMPAVLATRERFGIFRREVQAMLKPGIALASVPGGLMGDLLLLDHTACPDATLLGVDLDQRALDGARSLATERGLAQQLTLRHADAWEMDLNGAADVLTSNGLNIYEPDDERVTALYRKFFDALKPGGRLVTSFLTPPPMLSPESPWDMSAVTPALLGLQHLLFVKIIEAKWSAFRTQAQTRAQLEAAGFTEMTFIDDRARMFPTVVARKPA
ncbi:SAM-dependent methyltransferase [Paraburkholderia flava]|uniref:SAM-dependent methyltransferase n=1 Tax=Paraburkholderia flava TaxID=2547393 RepID=UPI00106051CE|nr:class I SAM-dependent methyltransferase [Paraburkholderia flava]